MTSIGGIFEELLLYSFSFLELKDLLHVERVSKQWQRISHDVYLWRRMFTYSFIHRVLNAPPTTNMKSVCLKAYKQAIHMWKGQCTISTLQHSVSPVLGVSKEKDLLVTGTSGEILIWKLDKMTRVDSVTDKYSDAGSTSKRLVALKRGKIVFSSEDHSISIYNIASKRLASRLVGHTAKVIAMNWDNPSLLCTGSRDGIVRFWDTRSFASSAIIDLGSRVRALRPHDSNPFVTTIAYGEGSVAIFDLRKPSEAVESFTIDEAENVTGMKITADSILYSTNHLALYKYCPKTHKTTAFIHDETSAMCVMSCNESTVMIGYNDGNIRTFSLETTNQLYSLRVGRDYTKVISMMSDDCTLAYGLDNGIAGVCNFEKPPPHTPTNPYKLPTSGTAYSSIPVTRTYAELQA
jgi:WD40 repeat protein